MGSASCLALDLSARRLPPGCAHQPVRRTGPNGSPGQHRESPVRGAAGGAFPLDDGRQYKHGKHERGCHWRCRHSPAPKTSHAPLTCADNASRQEPLSRPLPDTSEPLRCGYPALSAASCTRRSSRTPIEPGSIPNHHQPLDSDRSIQAGRWRGTRKSPPATGTTVYFWDPHSPWQRGTNENTNRLLQDYFPKGTDLSVHSPRKLAMVGTELNQRPGRSSAGTPRTRSSLRFSSKHINPECCDEC